MPHFRFVLSFAAIAINTFAHAGGHVGAIHQSAEKLQWMTTTELGRAFLASARSLTPITPRAIYRDRAANAWFREEKARALPSDRFGQLQRVAVDDDLYYQTRYGSPLTYLRIMEILGEQGVRSLKGKRVLDVGFGMIGQLRMWASMGADAVGLDVDPFLQELYSHPSDQGRFGSGSVRIVIGSWPADPAKVAQIGGRYDLIVSKNTLKLGYIHPRREAKKEQLIDLGVDDETYVRRLWESLNPGGYVLVFNISPAQNPLDKPYIPWADGETAFARDLWIRQGFQVMSFDAKDDLMTRALFRELGYDSGPTSVRDSVFTHWTLVRKG